MGFFAELFKKHIYTSSVSQLPVACQLIQSSHQRCVFFFLGLRCSSTKPRCLKKEEGNHCPPAASQECYAPDCCW
ncbi:Hypothetical predicted protein [Podarcis lilfordi]|uniref:Uncharacterized protein n=1 Tax=Podarcis lilfordi TaxID=74358 RepID=A0AA35JNG9_9SAUR|nr:Hypothetical predicted protein [Podarcis lilfordi]